MRQRPGRNRPKGLMPPSKKRNRKRPARDTGTREARARRVDVVGERYADHEWAGDVLGCLALRCHGFTERMREIGFQYADLRKAMVGSAASGISSYSEWVPPGPNERAMPGAAVEAKWGRCMDALLPLGQMAKHELDAAAVEQRMPQWFFRRNALTQNDKLARDALVSALRALQGVMR